MSKLNEEYNSKWWAGWPTKKQQYYFQRFAIIDLIYCCAGVGVNKQVLKLCKEVAQQLDVEQEKLGLNRLANKIKKKALNDKFFALYGDSCSSINFVAIEAFKIAMQYCNTKI